MSTTSLTGTFQPQARAVTTAQQVDFFEAIKRGDDQTVTDFVARVPGILESENSFKAQALNWAISSEQENIALKLIEAGADLEHKDNDGWTPVIGASFNGLPKVVERLIEMGVGLEHRTFAGGETALIMAGMAGKANCAEILMNAGADFDAVDSRGLTALQWAEQSKKMDAAPILREFPERKRAETQRRDALTAQVTESLKGGLPGALNVGRPIKFR